jgi:hypothetical protein
VVPSALIAGLVWAVIASLAQNGSYLLQHAGSRGAPAVDLRRPWVMLRGLLRSRLWLAGAAAGALGSGLHFAALADAPLSLVEAFMAGGLALTVPIGARAFGHRLDRSELRAVFVMVAALSLLGIGAGGHLRASVPAQALAAAVAVAAIAAAALACPLPDRCRGRLLGAAGGVLYGAADAVTKAVTMVHGGLIAAVTSQWMVVLVLLCVAAFACFQRGLQLGPAIPVIAVMTGATNAVAIVIGLVVYAEPLGAAPGFAALHILAFFLAVAAGLTLARAQGRLAPADQPMPSHREPAVPSPTSRLVSGLENTAPITASAGTSPA